MAAVKFDGSELRFVPDELRTKELCYAAIESKACFALAFIPEREKNGQLYLTALKKDIFVFEIIPKQYITCEMCNIAVKGYGKNLKYVPEELKTAEVCLNALTYLKELVEFDEIIKYIPKRFRNVF